MYLSIKLELVITIIIKFVSGYMSTLDTIIKCYFPAIPGLTIQWANKRIKGELLDGRG